MLLALEPAWIKAIAAAVAIYDNKQDILLFLEGPGSKLGRDPDDPVDTKHSAICLPNSTKVNQTNVIELSVDSACYQITGIGYVLSVAVPIGEKIFARYETARKRKKGWQHWM